MGIFGVGGGWGLFVECGRKGVGVRAVCGRGSNNELILSEEPASRRNSLEGANG